MSTDTPDSSPSFQTLGLKEQLLGTLNALGYEEPTPIQRESIPALLAGRDILGQAATGTGKTAAFALPLLQRIEARSCGPFEASALVLVPTRELAMQVAEAVQTYSRGMGLNVLAVYGGQEMGQQLRRLKTGADVVVATPGRALDHLRRRSLKLGKVRMVVLDEADEMLDMGFADDLDAILSELPETRQTALFSATLPPRIAAIAERHLKQPVRVNIRKEQPVEGALPKVRQVAYVVSRAQKAAALGRVLEMEAARSAIVFCRTRTEVESLTESLKGSGRRVDALHGGMSQEARGRVLQRFKAGQSELLVATDVAARGLHVDKLSHVINFDLPTSPEVYVHRIGRTGRAGEEGTAISFADPREGRLLRNIERTTHQRIEQAKLPTGADVRARKLGLLTTALREQVAEGGLDELRSAVERLSGELNPIDLAAAALKLVAKREGWGEAPQDAELDAAMARTSAQAARSQKVRDSHDERPRLMREGVPANRARPSNWSPRSGDFVKLFIGAGRRAGVRPADLVGAIANEAKVPGRELGAIEIADNHSVVEVPKAVAAKVQAMMRKTTLRGRTVVVNRHRS